MTWSDPLVDGDTRLAVLKIQLGSREARILGRGFS